MISAFVNFGADNIRQRRHYRRVFCAVVLGLSTVLASCSQEEFLSDRTLVPSNVHRNTHDSKMALNKPRIKSTKLSLVKNSGYGAPVASVTEVAAFGRGPYICSPSGFGHTSHCVTRNAYD
jgi:hypothetical protein